MDGTDLSLTGLNLLHLICVSSVRLFLSDILIQSAKECLLGMENEINWEVAVVE